MRKNSTNYTDSVICRKCYHPKQKKMYKNPALFHLTEPLSKDTPARCSGILKHIHGSINFHFFFLQVQPVYVKFFSLNRQPSEFCVKDNLICIKIYNIRYTGKTSAFPVLQDQLMLPCAVLTVLFLPYKRPPVKEYAPHF